MIRTTDRKPPLIVPFPAWFTLFVNFFFAHYVILYSIRTIVSYNHDNKTKLPTSYIHFDQVSCFNVFFGFIINLYIPVQTLYIAIVFGEGEIITETKACFIIEIMQLVISCTYVPFLTILISFHHSVIQ